MSVVVAVAFALYTIVSLILAVVTYQLGYNRGWLAGTAEALQDVYANEGDADE